MSDRQAEAQAALDAARTALIVARGYMPVGREIYCDDIQRDVDLVERALENLNARLKALEGK